MVSASIEVFDASTFGVGKTRLAFAKPKNSKVLITYQPVSISHLLAENFAEVAQDNAEWHNIA